MNFSRKAVAACRGGLSREHFTVGFIARGNLRIQDSGSYQSIYGHRAVFIISISDKDRLVLASGKGDDPRISFLPRSHLLPWKAFPRRETYIRQNSDSCQLGHVSIHLLLIIQAVQMGWKQIPPNLLQKDFCLDFNMHTRYKDLEESSHEAYQCFICHQRSKIQLGYLASQQEPRPRNDQHRSKRS